MRLCQNGEIVNFSPFFKFKQNMGKNSGFNVLNITKYIFLKISVKLELYEDTIITLSYDFSVLFFNISRPHTYTIVCVLFR